MLWRTWPWQRSKTTLSPINARTARTLGCAVTLDSALESPHLLWSLGAGCGMREWPPLALVCRARLPGHRCRRDIENAQHLLPNARLVQADIENGPWPLVNTTDSEPELFDAVVVTNYLWRPLMVTLLASLAPGGVLLFETFAAGNETVGRPVRPDFCYKTANCCTCAANCTLLPLRTVFWSNPTASCSASPLYVSLPPVHTMPLCRVMHSS